LLDAGLSNTEAFAANAFFTAGMVILEVPTGVLADTRGRRASCLLGTITLAFATLLYVMLWRVKAPLAAWAVASALLGLGFTFFSGAVEAWLVDALTFSGYTKQGGRLEDVFARGEIVEGIAMLGGSIAGGVVAQATKSGYALSAACGSSRPLLCDGVRVNARHRIHAASRHPSISGNQKGVARFNRQWARQAAGALGHADGAVHWRGHDLCVLCDAHSLVVHSQGPDVPI
jgi:MFS family permease